MKPLAKSQQPLYFSFLFFTVKQTAMHAQQKHRALLGLEACAGDSFRKILSRRANHLQEVNMLWHSNQWTDKVFGRCTDCKTCCNATPHKRCQSNLQGSCYIYLSQLSTTLGHRGQMMQLFDIPFWNQIAEHKPDDLCPVLQCMLQAAQLCPGSHSHSKGSILLWSEPTQTTKSEPLCLSRAARYHPTLEVLPFQPCWRIFSMWKLCHPVQTSVRKTQYVNFSWSFDKICREQLCKQLFQQIGGVVSSESMSGDKQQWWDAWDGIPTCQ